MLSLLFACSAQADDLHWNPAVDVPIMVGTGAIFGALYLSSDSPATPPVVGARPGGLDSLSPFHHNDTFATVSDVVLYGTLGATGVTALVGSITQKDARGAIWLESALMSGAITELSKRAVRRPRPYLYGTNEAEGTLDDSLSFFSGHTSWVGVTTFGLVHTLDIVHPQSPGLRMGMYGGATLLTLGEGALRVAAGKHFPSDVLVGALVGSSIGFLVPELHRNPKVQASLQMSETPMFRVSGVF